MKTWPLDRRLKCYPNPQRADGIFIAEDKPIEPYSGVQTLHGPVYPATPRNAWHLGFQVEPVAARRLVDCSNACIGMENPVTEIERLRRRDNAQAALIEAMWRAWPKGVPMGEAICELHAEIPE